MSRRICVRVFLLAFPLWLMAATSYAQQRQGDVGLGGQIGDPSGVTLRLYNRAAFIYDFLAAWDLDDFFFLNVHGLFERRFNEAPLNYFYGPGALFGIEQRRGENELVLGLSASVGINYFVERFEVFLQLTPRLNLIPRTNADLGGGVGLRYYF